MNKKYKILIALLFILIMLLGIIVIINNNNDNKVNISGGILQEGIIPGYTEEQIKEILQRKADESTFSFEINSRPIFKDGKSEGNLRIANPPYNKHLIKVEIKLDDNNKKVFESGEILPNHYIEYAKLTKKLKAGEYNATATINAYDIESGEYKGTSAAKLIIKIES
ncbi:hypothetical protein [Romboutsia timonensis]|uniref:hypothetical protein n=1 Tax=Romboutsia timonensis TaxID=1776391 RepID=UPI0008DA3BFC|nr:hypothetical protein [Romboutsia timonensis]